MKRLLTGLILFSFLAGCIICQPSKAERSIKLPYILQPPTVPEEPVTETAEGSAGRLQTVLPESGPA